MTGGADLVKCSQRVLVVRVESNVLEVDDSIVTWAAYALPVLRKGVPRVLDVYVIPMGWGGLQKAAKGKRGKATRTVVHDYRGQLVGF